MKENYVRNKELDLEKFGEEERHQLYSFLSLALYYLYIILIIYNTIS